MADYLKPPLEDRSVNSSTPITKLSSSEAEPSTSSKSRPALGRPQVWRPDTSPLHTDFDSTTPSFLAVPYDSTSGFEPDTPAPISPVMTKYSHPTTPTDGNKVLSRVAQF